MSGGTDILGGRGMDKNIDVQFATALQKKKIFKKVCAILEALFF